MQGVVRPGLVWLGQDLDDGNRIGLGFYIERNGGKRKGLDQVQLNQIWLGRGLVIEGTLLRVAWIGLEVLAQPSWDTCTSFYGAGLRILNKTQI